MEQDINPESRQKISFTKTLTVIVMVFTAILIISLVLLFFVVRHESSLSGAEQHIKLSAQGGFNCEYSEAQKLYPFAEGVMKVTSERAAYLTLSGNEVYSHSINYMNPAFISHGNYCLVYDQDGYSFSVFDKDGSIYSCPTGSQIKSASISDNGYVSIITSDQSSYGDVFVYSPDGTVISQWTSHNSGYPLSCTFNSDATSFVITTLNTSGAVPVPYIRVFDLTKTDNGIKASENSFYTTETNDILSTCFFLNDNLYAFSTSKIFKVSDNKLSQVNINFTLANYARLVGKHIFLIYSDGVDQINKLSVIDKGDKVVYNSDIGSVVNCVASSDSLFAVSVDNRIFVYNESGSVLGDISVDQDILRIGFISGRDLCIVSTGGVHTVNY